MKRWRFETLLLFAILSTCLVIGSANDENDDDDGVTIESEKVVSFIRSHRCKMFGFRAKFQKITHLCPTWFFQEYPKPAHESLDAVINYESPVIQPGKYNFAEHFDDVKTFDEKWVKSTAKKGDDGAYDGVWSIEGKCKTRHILNKNLNWHFWATVIYCSCWKSNSKKWSRPDIEK